MNKKFYSYLFLAPAGIIFVIIFLIPMLSSFFFCFTRWTLTEWQFIGFENFKTFLMEPSLSIGFKNTFIYAFVTSGSKVVLGLLLANFLCSRLKTKNFVRTIVYFPNLISGLAVGITFLSLMHPTRGLINQALNFLHLPSVDWLGNPGLALLSVAFVDVWKGVGVATVIYISGIMAIPQEYNEALMADGGNGWDKFWNITVPLSCSSRNTVILLSLIGGLKSFELVWAMTKGGPGFASDQLASIIYKQYSAGFYGISTAGNVILFLLISIVIVPLYISLTKKEVEL